ncbi:MAG: hypothetical protein J2P37_24020 [Ktedonobacteraceae bacterium]|nr:hypothetical protein [Ktedonobacteraceae bacterium]
MSVIVRRGIFLFMGINLLIIALVFFHPFGELYRYIQLTISLVGGASILFMTLSQPKTRQWKIEPWLTNERLAWALVGIGLILWGCGEAFWRYYEAIGEEPFPSLADLGYIWLPVFCFIGLLLQPASDESGQKRLLVFLDSLISMGALLAIGWYLLLGSLAQDPSETGLGKFLGLYYPTTDVALLSCIIFLLLRGQGRVYQATARRVSLIVLGVGLCFFTSADFIFNVEENAQKITNGLLPDYLWPLGMVIMVMAAYLRYTLPSTLPDVIEKRFIKQQDQRGFGPVQLIPYALIMILFITLSLNTLSTDADQISIRPVFLLATIIVVSLIVLRQILTIRENERLAQLQAKSLRQIEEQARHIAEHNAELEEGIAHLKAVQTSLANGNLHARAHLKQNMLWSLASSLNLLAERLTKLGQTNRHMELMKVALHDLSQELEQVRRGSFFQFPASCRMVPEIMPLVHALGLQKISQSHGQVSGTYHNGPATVRPTELHTGAPEGFTVPPRQAELHTGAPDGFSTPQRTWKPEFPPPDPLNR